MVGAAGLTFALAFAATDASAAVLAGERTGKALSPWVSIATDGTITIMSPATEMGQGSMTSLPLVIAEELDADWAKVSVVPAPPMDAIYGNPGFGGMMYTAGSNAVTSYFKPLRIFGAQVRRVLIENAAQEARRAGRAADDGARRRRASRVGPPACLWRDRSLCRGAGEGTRHQAGATEENKRVPTHRQGRHARRAAEQGQRQRASIRIDCRSPACSTAPSSVRRSRVRRPTRSMMQRRRRSRGVLDVVRLPYGVGVLAETAWAAFAGAPGALEITWTRTGASLGLRQRQGHGAVRRGRPQSRTRKRPTGARPATCAPKCRRRLPSWRPSIAAITPITRRWSR